MHCAYSISHQLGFILQNPSFKRPPPPMVNRQCGIPSMPNQNLNANYQNCYQNSPYAYISTFHPQRFPYIQSHQNVNYNPNHQYNTYTKPQYSTVLCGSPAMHQSNQGTYNFPPPIIRGIVGISQETRSTVSTGNHFQTVSNYVQTVCSKPPIHDVLIGHGLNDKDSQIKNEKKAKSKKQMRNACPSKNSNPIEDTDTSMPEMIFLPNTGHSPSMIFDSVNLVFDLINCKNDFADKILEDLEKHAQFDAGKRLPVFINVTKSEVETKKD